jgi:tRNA(Ile2) C34 agmatinyltransferase TiaS
MPNDPPKCPSCGGNTSSEGQKCATCIKAGR